MKMYNTFVKASWKEQRRSPKPKWNRIGLQSGRVFKGHRLAQRLANGSTNAQVKKLRNGIGAWIHQSNLEIWVPNSVRPMKDVNTNRTESRPAAKNNVRKGIGELLMYERTPDQNLFMNLRLAERSSLS